MLIDMSDVQKIILYTKSKSLSGKVIDDPSLVIKFNGGILFNSNTTYLALNEERMSRLAKLVEQYSEVKLEIIHMTNPY